MARPFSFEDMGRPSSALHNWAIGAFGDASRKCRESYTKEDDIRVCISGANKMLDTLKMEMIAAKAHEINEKSWAEYEKNFYMRNVDDVNANTLVDLIADWRLHRFLSGRAKDFNETSKRLFK